MRTKEIRYRNRKYDLLWYFFIFVSIVLFDQITKYIAKDNFDYTYSCFFIKFLPIINHGVSFGIFSNSSILNQYFLALVSLLLISLISYISYKKYERDLPIFYETLIISGAFSNVLDRYLYNGIVDFITINIMNNAIFPIGNIADIFICLGSVFLVINFYLNPEKFLNDIKFL